MKRKTVFASIVIGVLCQFAPQISRAQEANSIDAMPPVVVKTIPEAGTSNVSPGEVEIKVTFSKEMRDHSWSWSSVWKDSTPDFIGDPKYDANHKTCSVKVKLEPNKTYGFWLNSQNFHNFKDAQGHAAVPYLLVFQTGTESEEKAVVSAAQSWLAAIDNGQYADSWTSAGNFFRAALTQDKWVSALQNVRQPLGDLLSRRLISAQPATELPGAPDGKYFVMQFETSFANKKSAIETVTFAQEKDSQWKAVGYFIR
ncbi:MAG: DUF4019 domain-containing protein [Limisphaerales bacterium]